MASVRRSSLHNLIEQILKDAAHLPFEGVVRVLQQAHPDAPDIGFVGPCPSPNENRCPWILIS